MGGEGLKVDKINSYSQLNDVIPTGEHWHRYLDLTVCVSTEDDVSKVELSVVPLESN